MLCCFSIIANGWIYVATHLTFLYTVSGTGHSAFHSPRLILCNI